MIRTLDIFSSSKTEEIMSRYRPIAPKPLILPKSPMMQQYTAGGKTHQSPALRRSRKKTRARVSPATHKKARPHVTELYSGSSSVAKKTQLGLSLHGYGHGFSGFPFPSPGLVENPAGSKPVATPPLLPYACPLPAQVRKELSGNNANNKVDSESLNLFPKVQERALDLNSVPEIPEEKDLLQKLQAPFPGYKNAGHGNVIVPQPVRPVESSISVGCISESTSSHSAAPVLKRAEEVEEEVESEALPSVVSDSKNKVRMANSAYQEMVGQPECPWLDSVVTKDGRRAVGSKRINGEVLLDLSGISIPVSANGFSCRVKIEWASNGQKIFVNAPCDVNRLSCEARDYLFAWKFLIPNSKA